MDAMPRNTSKSMLRMQKLMGHLKPFSTDMFRLDGKVAIVTGASKGIGLDIALSLVSCGAAVIITSRNQQEIEDAAVKIKAVCPTGNIIGLRADSSRPEDAKMVVQQCHSQFGGLDILINNAAILLNTPITKLNDSIYARVLKVNLLGPYIMTQAALWLLKLSKSGRIINIGSVAGTRGRPGGLSAYSASKGGLILQTKSLALELSPYNITVNIIQPGPVATDMWESVPEEIRAGVLDTLSVKRIGVPRDISTAVVYFASNLASWITGSVFTIDGGRAL